MSDRKSRLNNDAYYHYISPTRRLSMVIYLFKVRNSILNPVISITGLNKLVQLWLRRSRSRSQLKKLSDEQLLDIGLSRKDAFSEASKAFWEK